MDDAELERASRVGAVVIEKLSRVSPAVDHLRRLHMDENDEILSTLLLRDVARWYEAVVGGTGDAQQRAEAGRVAAELDKQFVEGDAIVRNIIAVGFVESLFESRTDGAEGAVSLPASLRVEYENMGNWELEK